MCGPSSAMTNLNNRIQAFSQQVSSEATQVFGTASTIVNNLLTSFQKVVAGGPSQQGMSAAEYNARQSQIIEQSAASARNAKAAVGNAVSAIGGGNVVSPSGLETAVNLETANASEAAKSTSLQKLTAQDYEIGRQNYEFAAQGEMKLPSLYDSASGFNTEAGAALTQAQKSQAQMDAANNWWQPVVMKGIGMGASFLTGGLSNLGAGESAGEGVGDFLKGGLANVTGGN